MRAGHFRNREKSHGSHCADFSTDGAEATVGQPADTSTYTRSEAPNYTGSHCMFTAILWQ